jgi:hypothetical protein
VKQTITSAKTSLNQLPAVLRLINKIARDPLAFWGYTNDILDYGGGKYDQLTAALAKMKVRNLIYDPFNRSKEHNALVLQLVTTRPASHGICSNVLNVIREPAVRQKVLRDLARWVEPGGNVFITVHEGDKSSKGKQTSKGWQSNRPAKNYMREIKKVFPYSYGTYWGSKALIVCEVGRK